MLNHPFKLNDTVRPVGIKSKSFRVTGAYTQDSCNYMDLTNIHDGTRLVNQLASHYIAVIEPVTKASNPKEAIGASKLNFALVPDSLSAYAATAFYEGASKYGAYNWRVAGVRASTYYSAHNRHVKKWWNGQDADPKTKVHHLANAIACLGIILDAELKGMLNDDRPPQVDLDGLIERLSETQAHLAKMHEGMNPHHCTEQENGK